MLPRPPGTWTVSRLKGSETGRNTNPDRPSPLQEGRIGPVLSPCQVRLWDCELQPSACLGPESGAASVSTALMKRRGGTWRHCRPVFIGDSSGTTEPGVGNARGRTQGSPMAPRGHSCPASFVKGAAASSLEKKKLTLSLKRLVFSHKGGRVFFCCWPRVCWNSTTFRCSGGMVRTSSCFLALNSPHLQPPTSSIGSWQRRSPSSPLTSVGF